ncbi:COG0816 Predicted endonuclease involved in recombination (possible Holliday junction resolvase in Mycoplasmas and B. subtilis) [Candidatus Nanopelagicaceae bacterium]
MLRGRRIAFDFGDVRIGVAVSDPDSILCSPLTTLQAADKRLDANITQLLQEHEPVQIFVGRPALLSGNDGVASEKALAFAERIRNLSHVSVEMIDERMSTVSAARNLRDSGKSAKESKSSIDMAAAVAILEFALEIEKRK